MSIVQSFMVHLGLFGGHLRFIWGNFGESFGCSLLMLLCMTKTAGNTTRRNNDNMAPGNASSFLLSVDQTTAAGRWAS